MLTTNVLDGTIEAILFGISDGVSGAIQEGNPGFLKALLDNSRENFLRNSRSYSRRNSLSYIFLKYLRQRLLRDWEVPSENLLSISSEKSISDRVIMSFTVPYVPPLISSGKLSYDFFTSSYLGGTSGMNPSAIPSVKPSCNSSNEISQKCWKVHAAENSQFVIPARSDGIQALALPPSLFKSDTNLDLEIREILRADGSY